jgi:hypothetical protein
MPEDRDASKFVLSRRLIEAGARCVSFTIGGWDTHRDNFKSLSKKLPNIDRAMSALIEDLEIRIEAAFYASGDREMIQDLTAAAVNAALRNAQQSVQEELQRASGGIDLASLFPGTGTW